MLEMVWKSSALSLQPRVSAAPNLDPVLMFFFLSEMKSASSCLTSWGSKPLNAGKLVENLETGRF